jgi:hypothetical protein
MAPLWILHLRNNYKHIGYMALRTNIIAAPIGDGLFGAVDLDGIQRESTLWLLIILLMFLEELPSNRE